jgi:hypothetical protein
MRSLPHLHHYLVGITCVSQGPVPFFFFLDLTFLASLRHGGMLLQRSALAKRARTSSLLPLSLRRAAALTGPSPPKDPQQIYNSLPLPLGRASSPLPGASSASQDPVPGLHRALTSFVPGGSAPSDGTSLSNTFKLPAQGTAKPTRPGPEQGVVFDNQRSTVPCLTGIPPIHHPPPAVPRHGSFLPKRESPHSIQLLARIAYPGPKILIFEPDPIARVAAFCHFDSTHRKTGHVPCISPSFHLVPSTCRRSAESGDLNHRRTSKRLLLHSDSVSAAPYIIRTHASVKDPVNRWHAMTSL